MPAMVADWTRTAHERFHSLCQPLSDRGDSEKRAEQILHRARQAVGRNKGNTGDFSVVFEADEGELIAGLDACLFPDVAGQHHLASFVRADDGFDAAARSAGAAVA